MRNTTLAILLLSLLTSCSKSDEPPAVTFGTTYAKHDITPLPTARLFAGSGELKDAAAIDRLNAIDSTYAGYSSRDIATNRGFLDSITFETQSTARVSHRYQETEYSSMVGNGAYILSSRDTLDGFIGGTELSRHLQYFMIKPRVELYSESIGGVSQGQYYFYYRYRNKFTVRSGSSQDLAVPIVMYSWYKNSALYSRDYVIGEFDADFFKHIETGDTVVIREFKLYYSK